MKFKVIVPVYNAINYIDRCMQSLISQEYKDFDVIIVDDCSTDGTWERLNERYQYFKFRNKVRNGSGLANIIKGIQLSGAVTGDVIITVDGDDYLVFNNAISHLDQIYAANKNIRMTYGQFFPLSGIYSNFCKPVPDSKTYRKSGLWCTSHLRTFKKWLWDEIDDNDLRDERGEYFKVAWDRAFMYPMIEMSGSHAHFISKVMYMYNDLNPSNDSRKLPDECERTAQYIINKPSYELIK